MPDEIVSTPNPAPLPLSLPLALLNELFVKLSLNNVLSPSELTSLPADIKPRLLGHWGTCPGLTLIYAHLNRVIKNTRSDMIFVVGPGHGAPGILSSQYSRDKKGLEALITGFSTPKGFPSHINAKVPGTIHEGGELGYALAVSFGAVMDKPDLLVAVVVGDGEAETGPMATAWHVAKYLDPAESGAVIPIVHVNGFKISEGTIYGCMNDIELVRFIGAEGLEKIDEDMVASMDWAISEIRKIQKAAREGNPITKPRWPVLILRTPKGWTGPKMYKDARNDEGQEILQEWLLSYEPSTLFTEEGAPVKEILDLIPSNPMSQVKDTYCGHNPISAPDWKSLAVEKGPQASLMKVIGDYMDRVFMDNPKGIRLFSPDELESNKLDAALLHASRNFQGYTLTGRTALFPSYESFLGVVHTMVFVKLAKEVPWQQNASINYLETSTWARQEHNGFSHQNPSFIGAVLNMKPEMARVCLPSDANCFLSTMKHCLEGRDYTNLMVGSKQPTPVFLSPEEADEHCHQGASVWKFASTDEGANPYIVLVGIGTEVTMVNVIDLMILGPTGSHPHALSDDQFSDMFTPDRDIVMNYHGYVNDVAGLVFGATTTPFDMMIVNGVSRYHVAIDAVERGAKVNEGLKSWAQELVAKLKKRLDDTSKYRYFGKRGGYGWNL
ncbi:XFP N-terminal domain-containing protein [Trichophaea hybrida]|nr:XFP N-terminal domain-containing protein [Trichophaea hybrida]